MKINYRAPRRVTTSLLLFSLVLSQMTQSAAQTRRTKPAPLPPATTRQAEPETDSSRTWAYSDGEPLPTAEQTREALQSSVAGIVTGGSGKPLSSEEALSNARKFLNSRASSESLAAFAASPDSRNADRAAVAAAGAMIYHRPLAALAALLGAHDLQPRNAKHLVSLAAVLSLLRMPREALALLDAPAVGHLSPPLGTGGEAVALNARGHALLQLGRAKEAEVVLLKAVEKAPLLSEAKKNLAVALWQQGDPKKKEEAVRLSGSARRRGAPARSSAAGAAKNTSAGAGDSPAESKGEDNVVVKVANRNIDLSSGKELRLPELKLPRTLEQTVPMRRKYDSLIAELKARREARRERRKQLAEKMQHINEEKMRRANPSRMLVDRTMEFFQALSEEEGIFRQPKLRSLYEKMQEAERYYFVEKRWPGRPELYKALEPMVKAREAEMLPCSTMTPVNAANRCVAAARQKYDKLTCQKHQEIFAGWLGNMQGWDAATRTYVKAAYRYMTAVAANISDPVNHELAQLQAEDYVEKYFDEKLLTAASSPWANDSTWPLVCSSGEAAVGDLDELGAEAAGACPDELAGNNKAKLDLIIAELSINCESVSLEVSAGAWIEAFAEIEVDFEGEVTVGAGVKAGLEAPGVPGIEGKAGAYVTVDRNGDFKDAGVKLGAEASKSIGPIKLSSETSIEVSFIPAFAN